MRKLRLLDLYCCAGGAGMGYARAGFEVVGVDIKHFKRYPFEFHQADSIQYLKEHWQEFDAVHTSPPCQKFSITVHMHKHKRKCNPHPDLIEPTRQALKETGLPYIIENVEGAPLINPIMLCGTMFWLKVYRHRLFETNWPIQAPPHGIHKGSTGSHRGYSRDTEYICCAGHNFDAEQGRRAMRIDWMIRDELAQAIPPDYTQYIGSKLLTYLKERNEWKTR